MKSKKNVRRFVVFSWLKWQNDDASFFLRTPSMWASLSMYALWNIFAPALPLRRVLVNWPVPLVWRSHFHFCFYIFWFEFELSSRRKHQHACPKIDLHRFVVVFVYVPSHIHMRQTFCIWNSRFRVERYWWSVPHGAGNIAAQIGWNSKCSRHQAGY